MRILITGVNSGFNCDDGDISSTASIARSLGHSVTNTLDPDVNILICVDYHPKFAPLIRRAKSAGVPSALIKQEPIVTSPVHGFKNPSNLFDLVITRGDPESKPIFNTYQEWDMSAIEHGSRLRRIAAINADKWSGVKGELYSLRRICYSKDGRIDLFGRGWSDSNLRRIDRIVKELFIALRYGQLPILSNLKYSMAKPQNYMGPAHNKSGTLGSYHASLVIENCPFYMSEKLVDSILAGCIPIYVGADPEKFSIPSNLVIHCEDTYESVHAGITKALETDGQKFRELAKKWAETPGVVQFWESKSVTTRLLGYISDKLEVRD